MNLRTSNGTASSETKKKTSTVGRGNRNRNLLWVHVRLLNAFIRYHHRTIEYDYILNLKDALEESVKRKRRGNAVQKEENRVRFHARVVGKT